MIKLLLCNTKFVCTCQDVVVAVAGPIPLLSPLVAFLLSCPCCQSQQPSTSRHIVVISNAIIFQCPPATMFGTSFQQSSAYSPEQCRRGEKDHIHPPLSYFLLIVVFVAVKDTIVIIDKLLPSHSFARLHAVLPLPFSQGSHCCCSA